MLFILNASSKSDLKLSGIVQGGLDNLLQRQKYVEEFAEKMENPQYHIPVKVSFLTTFFKYFVRYLLTIVGILCLLIVIYKNPSNILSAIKDLFFNSRYMHLIKENNVDLYRIAATSYNRNTPVLEDVLRTIVDIMNNSRNAHIPPINQHDNILIIGPTGSGKSYFSEVFKELHLKFKQIAMQNITAPGYVGDNYTDLIRSVQDADLIHFDEVDKLKEKVMFSMMDNLSSNLTADHKRQIKFLSGVFRELQLERLIDPSHEIHQIKYTINNYHQFINGKTIDGKDVEENILTLYKAIRKYGPSAYVGLEGDARDGYNIVLLNRHDQTQAIKNALMKFYPKFSPEFWGRIPKIFYLQNSSLEQMITSVLSSSTYMQMQTLMARNYNAFVFYHPEVLIQVVKHANGNYREIESCIKNINSKLQNNLRCKSSSPRFVLVGFQNKDSVNKIIKGICRGSSISSKEEEILTSEIYDLDYTKKSQLYSTIDKLLFSGYNVRLQENNIRIFPFSIVQSFCNIMNTVGCEIEFKESFKRKIIDMLFSKQYDLNNFSKFFVKEIIFHMKYNYAIDIYNLWEKVLPDFIIGYKDFKILFSDIAKEVEKRKHHKDDEVIIEFGEGNKNPILCDSIDIEYTPSNYSNYDSEKNNKEMNTENRLIQILQKFVTEKIQNKQD